MYRMMRTATGPLAATGAGLLLLGTPEVLLWSREVVMDVPCMAFLLLAAAALLRYQVTKRSRTLLMAVLLTLAAVYTKQTAIFVAPAFAAVLLADEGWAFGRRKSTWLLAAIGVGGRRSAGAVHGVLCARNCFISRSARAPVSANTPGCPGRR